MTAASDRLAAAGLTLPPVAAPLACYVPALRVRDQIWTSGQLPMVEGRLAVVGKLGADVSPEQGRDAARLAALNAIAAVAQEAGGIDAIGRVLRVVVYVASTPDFTDQPAVANGASHLLADIFGGDHVRSAVGVAVLPLNSPVEVELVVEA